MTVPTEQTTQSTPLARLKERVKRFPALREEVKRLETLRHIAQLVAECRVQIERVRAQRSTIACVFDDSDTAESARALQQVQTRAESLERALSGGPQAWDAEVRRPVQDLKRSVDSATSAVQREWSTEVAAVVLKYERLGQALLKAGLDDGAAISDALARVRRFSEPPAQERDAQRAAEAVRSVAPSVARVGVSDAIGEFLVAALDGTGMARSLQDPTVVKFLNDNRLWDLLRVSIK